MRSAKSSVSSFEYPLQRVQSSRDFGKQGLTRYASLPLAHFIFEFLDLYGALLNKGIQKVRAGMSVAPQPLAKEVPAQVLQET